MKNEIQDNRTTEITDFPYGWNKGDTCIIITNKANEYSGLFYSTSPVTRQHDSGLMNSAAPVIVLR